MPSEPPPTITPADSAAPSAPPHPGATRAGRHGRPPRPNALNGPSRHTRETHSEDALEPLRNNPPNEEDPAEQTATTTFTPHTFKTTPE